MGYNFRKAAIRLGVPLVILAGLYFAEKPLLNSPVNQKPLKPAVVKPKYEPEDRGIDDVIADSGAQNSQDTRIENVQGDLESALGKIHPSTWQSASKITADMISDPSLFFWGWTADSNLYRIVGDTVMLDLNDKVEDNLILKSIDDEGNIMAIKQLRAKGNYFPPEEHVNAFVKSKNTLSIDMSELPPLEGDSKEWGYIAVSTNILGKVKDVKVGDGESKKSFIALYVEKYVEKYGKEYVKKYGEKVYDLFLKVRGADMFGPNGLGARLESNGRKETGIYFMTPFEVRRILSGQQEGKAIARASRLYDFGDGSYFNAVGWVVDGANGSLRGVRKVR